MEESRRLNLTCIAADKRGECHQGQGCKTGGAGQGKDAPGTGRLYSQQFGLVQKREGTHKSDEPVSKITWNS